MGSSKIQSRNIDAGADIAKESSVQEVITTSEEIKALVQSEVANAKAEIIAQMGSGTPVCVASDNVLSTLVSSAASTGTDLSELGTVRIVGFDGTIRIKAALRVFKGGYSVIKIYRFGDNEESREIMSVSSTSSTTKTYDMEVCNGDIIRFYLQGIGSGDYVVYCDSLVVCGTITTGGIEPRIVTM